MKRLKLAVRETKVEEYLVKCVKERNGKIYKTICVGQNGYPDRTVFLPLGIHILVECKKPVGGVLSAHQIEIHKDLRSRGHNVFVAADKETIDALMQMCDELMEDVTDES